MSTSWRDMVLETVLTFLVYIQADCFYNKNLLVAFFFVCTFIDIHANAFMYILNYLKSCINIILCLFLQIFFFVYVYTVSAFLSFCIFIKRYLCLAIKLGLMLSFSTILQVEFLLSVDNIKMNRNLHYGKFLWESSCSTRQHIM